jgi:N-acyl-L-homoserine lactone synthetase
MWAPHPVAENSYSDRLAALAARIDFRRVESEEEREAIFRLRYTAYRREDAIPANSSGRFADHDDETDNAYLMGLYIDGELAASLRLHVASRKANSDCPSLHVFPDVLQPLLDAGAVLVDTTRFVADERLSRLYRGLPLVSIRLCVVAGEYFGADHLLAAVRAEHVAFYTRSFGSKLLCKSRPYPPLLKPISLTTVHFPTAGDELYRRYPFYRSTAFERRKLFERRPHPASASHSHAAGAAA